MRKHPSLPVVEIFEAPACRTLLLAEPNQDIYDLGFKDGTHFIACEVEDFYDKAKYYLQNEKERQRITDNGYRLVHSRHTYHARAQEIADAIIDFFGAAETVMNGSIFLIRRDCSRTHFLSGHIFLLLMI